MEEALRGIHRTRRVTCFDCLNLPTAAIVEFPGVLYRAGAERKIRKYLVDNNYVEAVIQLPPDLFFGTSIATCILVLKKSKKTNDVVFINASAEFARTGTKNKLTETNRDRILAAFAAREDVNHFAKVVPNSDIAERAYTLSVTTYVDGEDTREVVDIFALNAEISQIVARQSELRNAIDEIVEGLGGASSTEDWRQTTIGAIAEVFDGPHATPKKTDEGPWYLSISSLVDGRFDLTKSAHLGADQFGQWTRRVAAQRGDTMFSYETRLGQAAFWDSGEPAALGRRMGLLRPKVGEVIPRYLTLAFLGPEFQALIRARTVRGATVERIPIADMASWPIALPGLDEQREVVEILDKCDALVSDLSIGLPAELNARRKQYAYYRDKLLTSRSARSE